MLIGTLAGLFALAMAAATPDWPIPVLLGLACAFGATAIGWNGVQLSELARSVPVGKAGAVTGAAGVITFSGVVVGPPMFAALASIVGYRAGFLMCAALSLTAASALALRTRGRLPQPRKRPS
jgi:MFS family permease